jgi:hypothetical protein
MNLEVIIDRWEVNIRPALDGGIAERSLRLVGEAKSRGILNGRQSEILAHPGKHALAVEKSAYGFTNVHGVSEGSPLRIEIWLGQDAWEELWRRSALPPSRTRISMEMDCGSDDALLAGRIFVTWLSFEISN